MQEVLLEIGGQVYSLNTSGCLTNTKTNRQLKGWLDANGYRCYGLAKKEKRLEHRLLAESFIPNPLNKPEINHIDGNTSNNNLNNLEWVTGSENIRHAFTTGLSQTKPIIDYTQVTNALQDLYNGMRFKELLIKYNVVDPSSLNKLLKRESIRQGELPKFIAARKIARAINVAECSRKVICTLTDGSSTEYPSMQFAARSINGNAGGIHKAIKHQKTYRGLVWQYA